MNRGVNRQTIFFGDQDRKDFESRLVAMRNKLDVTVLAYCLMGNHYHLLVYAPDGLVSDAMHLATSAFARHTNDRMGRDGPLFRGRFHALAVETEAYLVAAARYIHLNPLDLGRAPASYRWSSYGAYLGHRAIPEFLDPQPLLGVFEGRVDRLAQFTEEGGHAFDTRTVTAADVRQLVEVAVWMQTMDEEFHEGRSMQRHLALLLLDHPLGAGARLAIEEVLGPMSAEALRIARLRARRRLAAEATLRRALEQVLDALPVQAKAA